MSQNMTEKKLILEVTNLDVNFKIKDKKALFFAKPQTLKAVNNVSFKLYEGETLGVVGESGCGKSTLARAIIGLVQSSAGNIVWLGKDLSHQSKAEWKNTRKDIQMIFQDPLASLNPRMNIGEIIAEPLKIYQPQLSEAEVKERVQAMMMKVGLLPNLINRYPHEFSGGQCQRIGIARALIIEPKMIICDEPVSALDVSIQAKIINLLNELQEKMGIAYIFISHDLSVVKHIADRVGVMYLGNMMEMADTESLYAKPLHPYTQALFSAIPRIGKERIEDKQILGGDVPSPANPPKGCRFCTRCPKVMDICKTDRPDFKEVEPGHFCACHLYDKK